MADFIRTCVERVNAPTVLVGKDRAALVTGYKWPANAVIKIGFLDGDPALQARVAKAAQGWLEHVSLTFSFLDDPTDAPVRISFRGQGSWSVLGTQCRTIPKGQPTVNFGWLTPDSDDAEVTRVVLHELGHVLGLIHEHQNPAGGIPWNKDAVYDYFGKPPNSWSREEIDRNMFQPYDQSTTQFTAVDKTSIMMYPIPKAFTIDGAYEVGMNSTLSSTDKTFIQTMYGQ